MNLVLMILRFLFGPVLPQDDQLRTLAIRPDGRTEPYAYRDRNRHTRVTFERRNDERVEARRWPGWPSVGKWVVWILHGPCALGRRGPSETRVADSKSTCFARPKRVR